MGSIPFGFLIGRSQGVDLRKEGSGNIGATNAFRVLGPKWGTLVFLLDAMKGFLPLWFLGSHAGFLGAWGEAWHSDAGLLLCGLLVVLGHNYTPFLGFRGGKGIACSAGLLLALLPLVFLIVAAVWALFFLTTRIVSVASLAASLALPVSTVLMAPDRPALIGLAIVLGLVSIWRHRSNIQRLLAGTESNFRKGKAT